MRNLLRLVVFSPLLVALWPSQLAAAPSYCSSYPTIIESITPQAAIAGVTKVYVLGTCFGDTQGSGSVTIDGTLVTDILIWSDGEIVFTVPLFATSGNLVVTSDSYGSDTSANEGSCNNAGWCGTGEFSPDFTVLYPEDPPLWDPNRGLLIVGGSPYAPEYVTGTWEYDDGYGDTASYSLVQNAQNSDGTWPVTGNVHWDYDGYESCDQTLTGTLDGGGNLILNVGDDLPVCGGYSEEYKILNSGDMTSQGYFYDGWGTSPPIEGFPLNLGDEDNDLPLVNTGINLPWTESLTKLGWDEDAHAKWTRTTPESTDGNHIKEFAGRFVYEHDGGDVTDTCNVGINGGYPVALSGGGWYVDNSGVWGPDMNGIGSYWTQWYQDNQPNLPCYFSIPQAMYIDVGDAPSLQYTIDQLKLTIYDDEVCSEVDLQDDEGSATQGLLFPQGVQEDSCSH
jgi:IPT/TIG domain